ncbi:MAG: hypothetical protein JWO09_1342 [Bacteroidetes bacterium]|nr:hypothetical protein [Bacteroidota bacterium]
MDYAKLEQFVSKPRLDRYLISCANSQEGATKLYSANVMVSQAFYPIMNLLETFLRNSINDKLAVHFSDTAWIITQKNGFMNNASLGPEFWLKKQVLKAEANVRGTITPGKIVSEQTFGFWTSLFEPRHYRLIRGHVMSCFPNKPATIDRVDIAKKLKDIREFRNRIYHNEAICFNNITIDFTSARSIKTEIYNLLDWMDADLRPYVDTFDSIDAKIAHALAI